MAAISNPTVTVTAFVTCRRCKGSFWSDVTVELRSLPVPQYISGMCVRCLNRLNRKPSRGKNEIA